MGGNSPESDLKDEATFISKPGEQAFGVGKRILMNTSKAGTCEATLEGPEQANTVCQTSHLKKPSKKSGAVPE